MNESVAAVASFGDLATVRRPMARVLHLFDFHPDFQTRTGVAQLAARDGINHKMRTIGRGGDFTTAVSALLHLRRDLELIDIIHAWGSAALAAAAFGSGRRVIYSPTHFPSRQEIRWLRAILTARDVHLACSTETMRRAYVQRGIPIERCHLIRPGVDFGKVIRRRNDALRESLGFRPEDVVVLAPGESTRTANHPAAILAAAVLHVFDPKYKLLLWGKGPMTDSVRRFSKRMLPGEFMRIATDKLGGEAGFEELLPASDLALISASGPVSTLPIAICMAAGLPIVSVASRTVSELLEDRHSALMLGKTTSRPLARRVLDIQEDMQLQWKITDTAKTEAFEYFSMTRFVSQYRAVYEQIADGKPVEVPQSAPGAGMRFQSMGF